MPYGTCQYSANTSFEIPILEDMYGNTPIDFALGSILAPDKQGKMKRVQMNAKIRLTSLIFEKI